MDTLLDIIGLMNPATLIATAQACHKIRQAIATQTNGDYDNNEAKERLNNQYDVLLNIMQACELELRSNTGEAIIY